MIFLQDRRTILIHSWKYKTGSLKLLTNVLAFYDLLELFLAGKELQNTLHEVNLQILGLNLLHHQLRDKFQHS